MSNVTPICAVEQEPEPNVIQALLDMLAEARAGRLRGVLCLSPNAYWAAGEMTLENAMATYERWKFQELLVRLQEGT